MPEMNEVNILTAYTADDLTSQINAAKKNGWDRAGDLQIACAAISPTMFRTQYAILMVYHRIISHD